MNDTCIDYFGPKASRVNLWLAKAIRSNQFAPGDAIPSESELVSRFGISRMTVRRWLAALEREGLIRTDPGRGRFVASRTESASPFDDRRVFRIATAFPGHGPFTVPLPGKFFCYPFLCRDG